MQIEQGKFYKTRGGHKVGPAKPIENGGEYKWNVPRDGSFYGYTDDGVSCIDNHDDDLIAEWTDEPTGTLKWLADNHGLKAGDTVECVVDNRQAHIIENFGDLCYDYTESGIGVPIRLAAQDYRIVSRADDKPKIWDDMTDAEQGALLLAKHRGEDIQHMLFPNSDADYGWVYNPDPIFCGQHAYRIKPEPVVETVVLYGRAVGFFEGRKGLSDTHKLTYTTTNGVIDCDSVNLEAL